MASGETVVTLPKPKSKGDLRYQYDRALLTMALEVTRNEYGPFRISDAPGVMSHKRTRKEITRGRIINVLRSPTSRKLEANATPVRIPIFMGLLGYRVLLIREADRPKFSKVHKLEDLANYRAGQGAGWVDIPILRKNGVKVIEGTNYNGLFGMLAAGRFDYFPRGVNEILAELTVNKPALPSLVVEHKLLLHYPFPVYFFVSKNEPRLARRIRKGLTQLSETGQIRSLLQRFFGHHIRILGLADRKIIRLNNPFLPPQTPIENKTLWLNPVEGQPKENPAQG